MSAVHFDPKITPDLPIDWRRPASGQASDLFADLLKQRSETDQRESTARRHDDPADPLPGRRPRLVVAHPKTLRGEAKEGHSPDDRCPADGTDSGMGEVCGLDEGAAAGAPVQDEASGASIESGPDATSGQAVQPIEQQTAGEAAQNLVPAHQPSPEQALDCDAPMTAMPAEPVTGDDGQVPAAQHADRSQDAARTESNAATEAVAAMALSGPADAAAALSTAQPLPPSIGASTPATATSQRNTPAAPVATEGLPVLQAPIAPMVAEAGAEPALRTRPERSSMDVKLRPGTTPTGRSAPDPAPSSNVASQSMQPHQASMPQPAEPRAFTGTSDPLELPIADDGTGWTPHLAQGPVGKRADFIAQLRPHLQNLPVHEQVAVHIQRAAREGTGRFSIQLSPAELGHVHVKLEIDEDKRVTAAVTVERPSTLELLQRDVKGLERALHDAGLRMEGGDLSFSLGRGGEWESGAEMRQSTASAAGTVLDAGSEGSEPAAPVSEVTDTAAGVVNLQV